MIAIMFWGHSDARPQANAHRLVHFLSKEYSVRETLGKLL